MFAIVCSLLALAISVIAVWRSGNRTGAITPEKVQEAVTRACANPSLEKAGRNSPPPANFQKPDPTPDPPPKRYYTGNPISIDPFEGYGSCHWDDTRPGETEHGE